MKAVLVHVTEQDLAHRRRLGLDRYDEMWEGVLHMTPAPDYEHQRIKAKLHTFLDNLLSRHPRGLIALEVNVFNDASSEPDYRIPDLSFLSSRRESLMGRDGIHGGPDAVIEIRSPEDETYEKFPFFASLGVREVVVIHRDSKRPEIHRLAAGTFAQAAADSSGWVASETMGIRMRASDPEPAKLLVEDAADHATRAEI
jgi:Uma2 family endonuclease